MRRVDGRDEGTGRRLRGWHAVTALVLGAVLAGCASSAPPIERPGATGPTRYVALGDSWVSGPLVPDPIGTPIDCGRSSRSFPWLLAESLDVAQFADVSCGGAKIRDLTRSQKATFGGRPAPQFAALTPDTTLVTIGIGGNDVKFPDFAIDCANLIAIELGPPPFGRPCSVGLTENGVDEVSRRIQETRPRLDAALAGIRRRAPLAEVYVIGYPVALPDAGSGCWPRVPILPPDVEYLRAKYIEMNAMLADAAQVAGYHFVDTYAASIGHDVCQPVGTAWVNAITFEPNGIPMHPNSLSHANTASVVAGQVRASLDATS